MQRTALFDAHERLGARLIDFGGWEMPVVYRGILDEHNYTRTAASAFDVSHMGRLYLTGKDAEAVLQRTCTRNVGKMAVGRCGYSHICNEAGGILDDVIVSRFEDKWLVVCNAGNRSKIVAHLQEHLAGRDVKLDDQTTSSVMIAIQGPAAMELFNKYVPIKVGEIKRYAFATGSYMGMRYSIFRTGYTGEDGLEVVVPSGAGVLLWDFLTKKSDGNRIEVKPAGLGARDTLRLEAGMPLYGHELGEHVDPISAACKWCVDLEKDFIGASALRRINSEGPKRRLIGLELDGKRIARQGASVMSGDAAVGEVTSGTLSPTLGKSIAMAYVDSAKLDANAALAIDFKGTQVAARVTPMPFYKRAT